MRLTWTWALVIATTSAVATALMAALLVNISERKEEARNAYVELARLTEDDTDPAIWGRNWPRQYDSYKRTALSTRTRFGGHGGSEALPAQKIERDPWLKRMFLGYAFSIDYRDRRGHAYMLADQEQTKRQTKPQSGSCLHCHGSVMPLYRELGDGDAMKGFEETFSWSYEDLNAKLHDMGHGYAVSCVDCHSPETMALRVTRPAFINGIRGAGRGRWRRAAPAIGAAVARRRPDRPVRSEPGRHADGDALLRVWSMPRGVLLRQQDAPHLPVGERFDGG
jgi:nitrite reductase (cytochrome c-552)